MARVGACSDHFLLLADAAAEAADQAEANGTDATPLRHLARDAVDLAPRYAARPLPRQ